MMDVLAESLLCAEERLEQGILRIDLLLAEIGEGNSAPSNGGPFAENGPWKRQLVEQREVLARTVAFIEALLANPQR